MKKITTTFFIPVMWMLLSLFGCRTTKEVVKMETIYDSAAIMQNEALHKTLQETIEHYERQIEQWESTGVVFNDTPCPDSPTSVKPSTKIIFDNGKLKSIEGNVRALNQSLYEKNTELIEALYSRDSLVVELEKARANVSKTESVHTKEVKKKAPPWWLFLLCILIGSIGEYRLKYLQRFLSLATVTFIKLIK